MIAFQQFSLPNLWITVFFGSSQDNYWLLLTIASEPLVTFFLATIFCWRLMISFGLLFFRKCHQPTSDNFFITTIIDKLLKNVFYVCHFQTFDNCFSTTNTHIFLLSFFDNYFSTIVAYQLFTTSFYDRFVVIIISTPLTTVDLYQQTFGYRFSENCFFINHWWSTFMYCFFFLQSLLVNLGQLIFGD